MRLPELSCAEDNDGLNGLSKVSNALVDRLLLRPEFILKKAAPPCPVRKIT
jgi:hypothetical protein